MATCDVYKGTVKLGSGSITNGASQITGFTEASASARIGVGQNIQIVMTSSTDISKVLQARITAYVAATSIDFTATGAQGGNTNPFAT